MYLFFYVCCMFRKRDQMLQKKMLQKKLNRKKFLAEDLNKLLTVPANERHKNDIPGAYVS